MDITTLMRRVRVRTDWIDSPSDIALIIIAAALVFAAHYFLPKYFPNLSQRMVKIICYGAIFVLVIIWSVTAGGI